MRCCQLRYRLKRLLEGDGNIYLLDFDEVLAGMQGVKHFRYVDDLVVFCKDAETAERVYRKVKKLFADIELAIHDLGVEGKTYIDRFDSGKLDVLGVIYKNGRLMVKSKKYKKFIQERINPIQFKSCLDLRHSTIPKALDDLLRDLDFQVNGWAAAYAFCDVKENFIELDKALLRNFERLLDKLEICGVDRDKYIGGLPKFIKAIK